MSGLDALDDLGDRLAAVRRARKLSYRDVADQTGILISTLHRLEHGGDPQLSTVRKVVAWLESLDAEERAASEGSGPIGGFCDAYHPWSGARCYLEPGHGGPYHQAFTHYPGQVVSWPIDMEAS